LSSSVCCFFFCNLRKRKECLVANPIPQSQKTKVDNACKTQPNHSGFEPWRFDESRVGLLALHNSRIDDASAALHSDELLHPTIRHHLTSNRWAQAGSNESASQVFEFSDLVNFRFCYSRTAELNEVSICTTEASHSITSCSLHS
jgi:hypothetical protein